ncbi:hypothetical protein T06_14550 [Trichinella sp. T6]|nr:hypothetical protein T06_14550 [Trichinella sp. T6]
MHWLTTMDKWQHCNEWARNYAAFGCRLTITNSSNFKLFASF